ncbi:hypothetical protein F4678DRAFT_467254 [Xylaria arbuscula]|nr:hypothetical protein F4678DRAFT_467254 [Xylaria arbuscula]
MALPAAFARLASEALDPSSKPTKNQKIIQDIPRNLLVTLQHRVSPNTAIAQETFVLPSRNIRLFFGLSNHILASIGTIDKVHNPVKFRVGLAKCFQQAEFIDHTGYENIALYVKTQHSRLRRRERFIGHHSLGVQASVPPAIHEDEKTDVLPSSAGGVRAEHKKPDTSGVDLVDLTTQGESDGDDVDRSPSQLRSSNDDNKEELDLAGLLTNVGQSDSVVWAKACAFFGHDLAFVDEKNMQHHYRHIAFAISIKSHQLMVIFRLLFMKVEMDTCAMLLAGGMGVGKTLESVAGSILFRYIRQAIREVRKDREEKCGRHLPAIQDA